MWSTGRERESNSDHGEVVQTTFRAKWVALLGGKSVTTYEVRDVMVYLVAE
jgi:hypothetical protein